MIELVKASAGTNERDSVFIMGGRRKEFHELTWLKGWQLEQTSDSSIIANDIERTPFLKKTLDSTGNTDIEMFNAFISTVGSQNYTYTQGDIYSPPPFIAWHCIACQYYNQYIKVKSIDDNLIGATFVDESNAIKLYGLNYYFPIKNINYFCLNFNLNSHLGDNAYCFIIFGYPFLDFIFSADYWYQLNNQTDSFAKIEGMKELLYSKTENKIKKYIQSTLQFNHPCFAVENQPILSRFRRDSLFMAIMKFQHFLPEDLRQFVTCPDPFFWNIDTTINFFKGKFRCLIIPETSKRPDW